jgi:predicted amidohydrolase YtcJ
MQPSHMTYDDESGNYNPARLGPDRIKHAFPWKELEQSGALLVFGTDWPVVPLEPRLELFAATTREHMNGKPEGGWIPEQKVTLVSAIQHYTLDPAKAIGREREIGTLNPGMLADLVVLDRDLFATSGLDLLKVETDLTVFDGRVVYERAP